MLHRHFGISLKKQNKKTTSAGFLSILKKTLHSIQPHEKHSKAGEHILEKFNIKRKLHKSKYKGFTTRCKTLISLKDKIARIGIDFATEYLKHARSLLNTALLKLPLPDGHFEKRNIIKNCDTV